MSQPEYMPPILTVDAVIFQLENNVLSVLLIKRASEPFKDCWALPGGYNAAGETTTEAMSRVLLKKGGVKVKDLNLIEQLYTFDTVARDPRGHAVSVTYLGLAKDIAISSGTSTEDPRFFPIDHLPKLAYDHKAIIEYAQKRLRSKITYTSAIFALLSEQFTLSQLQVAYEAILSHPLDKRNFRKKFLSLDVIEKTPAMLKDGAHRPARLYRFTRPGLQRLERNFE